MYIAPTFFPSRALLVYAAGLAVWTTALPAAAAQAICHAVLATPQEAMRRFVIEEALADLAAGAPVQHSGPAPETDPVPRNRDVLVEVGDAVGLVAYRFLAGITPGRDGIERPSPVERAFTEFEVPLGDTPLSYVLHGVGNYRHLSLSYYYQQYDGVHSLRFNLVPADDRSPFRVSISGSPLHGSISIVNRHMGVEENEDLPDQVLYGGSAGVNASYESGPLRVELRGYLMPEVDVGWTGATGVAQVETLEAFFDLNEVLGWARNEPLEASVEFLHMERGEARRPLYDHGDGSTRGVRDVREIWQGMMRLTIRYD